MKVEVETTPKVKPKTRTSPRWKYPDGNKPVKDRVGGTKRSGPLVIKPQKETPKQRPRNPLSDQGAENRTLGSKQTSKPGERSETKPAMDQENKDAQIWRRSVKPKMIGEKKHTRLKRVDWGGSAPLKDRDVNRI